MPDRMARIALALLAGALAVPAAHADPQPTTEAAAPRDAHTGLATGKRQHEPVSIHKTVDAATPKAMASPSTPADTAKVKAHSNTNNN
ncbi:MAG TPA: hypothetical protein VFF98_03975 [Novosphingobium sp.]|nr:hypothetical protein [Novosphingobium sp.]